MLLTSTRYLFTPTATLSRLSITYDGALAYGPKGWSADAPRGPLNFGYVLEDCDRGLDQSMDLAEIKRRKVARTTAIPAGRYLVSRTWSNRFHDRTSDGKMILLHNVPGYEGIRCHHGRTAQWTDGCMLVGTEANEVDMTLDLGKSESAWRWLDARVRECDERDELVWWEIGRSADYVPA